MCSLLARGGGRPACPGLRSSARGCTAGPRPTPPRPRAAATWKPPPARPPHTQPSHTSSTPSHLPAKSPTYRFHPHHTRLTHAPKSHPHTQLSHVSPPYTQFTHTHTPKYTLLPHTLPSHTPTLTSPHINTSLSSNARPHMPHMCPPNSLTHTHPNTQHSTHFSHTHPLTTYTPSHTLHLYPCTHTPTPPLPANTHTPNTTQHAHTKPPHCPYAPPVPTCIPGQGGQAAMGLPKP